MEELISLSEIPENEFTPLPEQSLEDLKASVIINIDNHAIALHEKISKKYSSREMASWAQKEAEAKKFLDNGVISDYLRMEAIDGNDQGLSESEAIRDFAQLVLTKADFFHTASRRITSARRRHSNAIASMQTKEDVINYDWWSEGWI